MAKGQGGVRGNIASVQRGLEKARAEVELLTIQDTAGRNAFKEGISENARKWYKLAGDELVARRKKK